MTEVQDIAASLTRALRDAQRSDGSLAMRRGGPAATEPTALAALAFADRDPAVLAAATAWLARAQRPDGAWSATVQVDEPSWAGGVALLALALLDREPERVTRGATWLLGREGTTLPLLTRMAERWRMLRGREVVSEMDATLRGWPWIDGTFSWVEPTSVAMLALRAAAAGGPAPARDARLGARLATGARLLVDRDVPAGGWNYGNARVLGEDLEAYPDTTAWALLALAPVPAVAGAPEAVARALAALSALMAGNRSPLTLALVALAVRAHGRDDRPWRDALAARLESVGLPADVRSQALALLALAGPRTPFHR